MNINNLRVGSFVVITSKGRRFQIGSVNKICNGTIQIGLHIYGIMKGNLIDGAMNTYSVRLVNKQEEKALLNFKKMEELRKKLIEHIDHIREDLSRHSVTEIPVKKKLLLQGNMLAYETVISWIKDIEERETHL